MAQVNTGTYGSSESWLKVINYNANIAEKKRLKYVNYTNDITDIRGSYVYKGVNDNLLAADVPFDNTISYCGIGSELPLSNLIFNRNVIIYYFGSAASLNEGKTYSDFIHDSNISQQNDVTMFAFARMSTPSTYIHPNTRQLVNISNDYRNLQHQRWGPNAYVETIAPDEDSSHHSLNYFANTTMYNELVAQIPVKNAILVPTIRAIDSITTNNPNIRSFSPKQYFDTTQEYNYTTHPHIFSVCVSIYTKTQEEDIVQELDEQWGIASINGLHILNESRIAEGFKCDPDSLNGYPWPDDREPLSTILDYTYCANYNNSQIPIMGKILNPTVPNLSYARSMTQNEDLDLWGPYGIDYYGSTKLGDVEANIWAGPTPTMTEWQDPTAQSAYEIISRSRTYWTYDVNASNADEYREMIRHAVAGFGMFFVEDAEDVSLPLDDYDMFLGYFKNHDGIGHGDYSRGEDNRNQDQWNWDDMHEADFDPDVPTGELPDDFPSQDEYSKFEYDNTTPRGMWRPFVGSYVLDAGDVYNLVYACTDHYITMQDAIEQYNSYIVEHELTKKELDLDSFLMRQWGGKANPMDCFITAVHYPFDISRYIEKLAPVSYAQVGSWITPQLTFTSGTLQIHAGKTTTDTTYGEINLGSITFPVRTNPGTNQISAKEFSSFAPYVSATLYLPFCGSIEIEPEMYVDKNIGVRYVVDWRTGTCLALVYRVDGRSNYVLDQAIPGQMGDTITLAMQDTTSYAATLANGTMQEQSLAYSKARNIVGGIQSGVNVGMGIASIAAGDVKSGIGSIANGIAGIANAGINAADLGAQTNKAQYDIGVSQIPTRRVGTSSPCANSMSSMVARLTFVYSKTEAQGNFTDIMGHACLWFGTVNDSRGYTECSNLKLDGISTATAQEKSMIQAICASGFYVNEDD